VNRHSPGNPSPDNQADQKPNEQTDVGAVRHIEQCVTATNEESNDRDRETAGSHTHHHSLDTQRSEHRTIPIRSRVDKPWLSFFDKLVAGSAQAS
jgi:hypothetical protein